MYRNCIKRLLDILISLVALPFVVIVIIIMTPIIFLSDPGPIFFTAYRRGKNGKKFKMLKFRSMYINSPDIRNEDGSTFNGENDPRVTKIGKLMRKTSLDEIPQILNVLVGDMSYIGPRPTLVTKAYKDFDDDMKKRVTIRPGITGYAQAYYRNSIGQDEKFKYDLYYVDNVSFVLDVKILFHTIKSVLGHENIYISTK